MKGTSCRFKRSIFGRRTVDPKRKRRIAIIVGRSASLCGVTGALRGGNLIGDTAMFCIRRELSACRKGLRTKACLLDATCAPGHVVKVLTNSSRRRKMDSS